MSLDHDFLLLDRDRDGEWELLRFINDPRAIHLHDDFVHYLADTLEWIPTVNPARREPHRGLCMWGPTLIEAEGAIAAKQVFGRWAELFAAGPPVLDLSGGYVLSANTDSEAGGYEKLKFNRDEVVGVLRQLTTWCGQIRSAKGRLYLYHGGV